MPKPKPQMPEASLTALRGSIAKWQAIVDGTGGDWGTENCPLCVLFYDCTDEPEDHENGPINCSGCPVSAHTGASDCIGSPYIKWMLVQPSLIRPFYARTIKQKLAAKRELAFLISLLPPDAKERGGPQ